MTMYKFEVIDCHGDEVYSHSYSLDNLDDAIIYAKGMLVLSPTKVSHIIISDDERYYITAIYRNLLERY